MRCRLCHKVSDQVLKPKLSWLIEIEDHVALNEGTARTPSHVMDNSAEHLPAFIFPLQHLGSNVNVVDVNELSASLGLPGARKNAYKVRTHSHQNHPSQSSPDVYHGLIDRALDKPLTAGALAHFLNRGKSNPSEDMAVGSPVLQKGTLPFGVPDCEGGQSMKVVPPLPGNNGEIPDQIAAEQHNLGTSAATEPQYALKGQIDLQHTRHRSQFQPANLSQHHARHPSDRRYPRAPNRVRRTDQGPEPSAADIYPEDAELDPSYRRFPGGRAGQYHQPFKLPTSPRLEFQINNAIGWPTPAEVYAQKSPTPTPTPPYNIFENHVSPTEADINATDDIVITLIGQLPDPSMDILLNFSAFYIMCDKRSLTPGQLNGSRYGMRHNGLALGDSWNPVALVNEGGPSRGFLRNHFR